MAETQIRLRTPKKESASMTAPPKVLIVASDQAMRRSLTFALEAEGYAVDAEPRLDAESYPLEPENGVCVIVDQDALANQRNPTAELAKLKRPVILLVERLGRPPVLPGLRIVEKPPLGRDLLDAVAAALDSTKST